MEHSLLIQMHDKIDEFEKQGLFNNKFIVVFGSNEPAERIMEYLASKNIFVNALVDNNKKKDGTFLNKVKVTLPDKLLLPKNNKAVILIASKYYPEMVVQLSGMGYKEGTEILKVVEYSSFSAPVLTEDEFEKRCSIVLRGEKIYKNIINSNSDIQKIFICPLIVLGDAYVGMSCMREYIKLNNITEYALVLVNRACSKIAALFGFDSHVYSITREEMNELVQYAVFSDMADKKILILNHRHPYTCRIGEIGNYKNINFMDHFRYSIFNLPEGNMPEVPNSIRDSKESKQYVEQLFNKNRLVKGKTVIIFPYAKTAAKLDEKFWIKLVIKLKEQGYKVCTNSSSDSEPAIEGTIHLFFDIRYALETVEAAGYVIGLRSGLCDVISTAKAKKIIIYPDRFYGPDSFINFFSLNKMNLCDDAVELVWKNNIEEMLELILGEIEFHQAALLVDKGRKFWKKLLHDYSVKNKDLIVILASKRFDYNYYTLAFLPELKKQKKIENIILLSHIEKINKLVEVSPLKNNSLVFCTEEDILNIYKLYMLYKFSNQLIINTYENTSDVDGGHLEGINGISVKDIVAISILGLFNVPNESEFLDEYEKKKVREEWNNGINR